MQIYGEFKVGLENGFRSRNGNIQAMAEQRCAVSIYNSTMANYSCFINFPMLEKRRMNMNMI